MIFPPLLLYSRNLSVGLRHKTMTVETQLNRTLFILKRTACSDDCLLSSRFSKDERPR